MRATRILRCGVTVLACGALAGCGDASGPRGTVVRWLVAGPIPAADPGGAPEEVRWAMVRLLTRGLVDEDSSGSIVPMLAESVLVSSDRRTYRFVLRDGLSFADGSPLTSADVRETMLAGLGRSDHALYRWVMRSVLGVSAIRPGRSLPALGIEAPDSATLVLHLSRPDSLLLRGLALPGVSAPLRLGGESPGWGSASGAGPYRVLAADRGSLVLVRRPRAMLPIGSGPDTIRIRFALGARVRSLLRTGTVDALWPVALGDPLRDETPEACRWVYRPASALRPPRTLALVIRADVAPTARLAARRALAHSFHRDELRRALGESVAPFHSWWEGAGPYDMPRLDAQRTREWLALGNLGRSFRTTMVFDPDEVHESAARRLQTQWARADLSVELLPLRGPKLLHERMEGRAQLLLLISRPPVDLPEGELAVLTRLDREKPVGAYRSGWSTDDFRPWIGGERPFREEDWIEAQDAIEAAGVVLPVGRVGASWIERRDAPGMPFHPHFGLDLARYVTGEVSAP